MRILQYAFFSLIFLVVGIFILFILAQEIFIFWGGSSLQGAIYALPKSGVTGICQDYLNQYSEDKVKVGYQLRFVSDTTYISEAYCDPFNSNATEIKQTKLPPFVTKIPGSSGVIWGEAKSGIGITVFKDVYAFIQDNVGIDLSILKKQKYISAENETVVTESVFDTYGQTPIAACEGYGFQCCDSVAEEGLGEQLVNTTNCERTCFSSCARRPVILSFMSDPFPDLDLRETYISKDTTIIFQYLIDTTTTQNPTVILDFGDGTQETSSGNSGSIQHAYTCETASCTYNANLAVIDSNGRTSAVTPLSGLKIVVTQ